ADGQVNAGTTPGIVNITATDPNSSQTASVEIKVAHASSANIWVEDEADYYLGGDAGETYIVRVGQTFSVTLWVETDAGGAGMSALAEWFSSDEGLATVAAGVVTGVAPGFVKISTTIDGQSDEIGVVVTNDIDAIAYSCNAGDLTEINEAGGDDPLRAMFDITALGGPKLHVLYDPDGSDYLEIEATKGGNNEYFGSATGIDSAGQVFVSRDRSPYDTSFSMDVPYVGDVGDRIVGTFASSLCFKPISDVEFLSSDTDACGTTEGAIIHFTDGYFDVMRSDNIGSATAPKYLSVDAGNETYTALDEYGSRSHFAVSTTAGSIYTIRLLKTPDAESDEDLDLLVYGADDSFSTELSCDLYADNKIAGTGVETCSITASGDALYFAVDSTKSSLATPLYDLQVFSRTFPDFTLTIDSIIKNGVFPDSWSDMELSLKNNGPGSTDAEWGGYIKVFADPATTPTCNSDPADYPTHVSQSVALEAQGTLAVSLEDLHFSYDATTKVIAIFCTDEDELKTDNNDDEYTLP
ncbi:hypothetical protein KAI87_06205, partial [Myxococcota bacterium]|nr:hypothetical protein [Myxococcota bacterium]